MSYLFRWTADSKRLNFNSRNATRRIEAGCRSLALLGDQASSSSLPGAAEVEKLSPRPGGFRADSRVVRSLLSGSACGLQWVGMVGQRPSGGRSTPAGCDSDTHCGPAPAPGTVTARHRRTGTVPEACDGSSLSLRLAADHTEQ
eukprot:768357-Hanusia_phi.AAC.2